MSDFIIANEIHGDTVYGVKQYEFTVGGDTGKDYADALAAASLKESVAIEDSATAYAEVIRQRERKVSDLGEVLAALAQSIATMDPKSQDTSKKSDWSSILYDAKGICDKYGVSLPLVSVRYENNQWEGRVTYREATKAQNDIQYELDKEDNNLQQDMVALQSYITKRDNAYSAAAKIVQKAIGSASGIIRNIT